MGETEGTVNSDGFTPRLNPLRSSLHEFNGVKILDLRCGERTNGFWMADQEMVVKPVDLKSRSKDKAGML